MVVVLAASDMNRLKNLTRATHPGDLVMLKGWIFSAVRASFKEHFMCIGKGV